MANKSTFDLSLRCYTKDAIPKRTRKGFVLTDVYSDLVRFGWSDALDMVAEINPTISLDWQAQPEFVNDGWRGNINFVRFSKDGRVQFGATPQQKEIGAKEDIAGFCLKWREAWLDCKVGTTVLDAGNFDQKWKRLQGKWETVLPADGQQHTCLMNSGSDLTARIQSVGNVPANRGLLFSVDCIGVLDPSGPVPRVRVAMPKKKYTLLLAHGSKPAVQIPNGSGGWSTLRTLKDAPTVDLRRNRYRIHFMRIGGRLVVGINGEFYHITETAAPLKPGGNPTPKESTWPEGPIQVNAFNCRIVAGVALIKYASAADVPYSAGFERQVKKAAYLEPGTDLVAHAGGWEGAGTLINVVPTVGDTHVSYVCSLTANAQGIDTPLVTKVIAANPADWSTPSSAHRDIRPALTRVTMTNAMPPILPGAEVSVECDRSLLDTLLPDWQTYVDKYHPVDLRVKWHYDNGTEDADYTLLFKGYIYQVNKATSGVNQNTMTLHLVDPVQARLKAPAAVIDHHYPPLDWFWMGLVSGVDDDGSTPAFTAFYGYDGVKEILNIALGPNEASRLNGTGDGGLFFTDHYPLLSVDMDTAGYLTQLLPFTQPPTQSDLHLPAPHGQDAYSWITQLAEYDHAIFYYGWPDGLFTDDWPAPIYGRITNIVATRPTYTIPDNDYNAGDVNKILKEASTETRPDRDVNRFLAWANLPNTDGLNGLLPAFRMAEDRLKADDPNRPELTWERTLVAKNDILGLPGAAEIYVKLLALELRKRNLIFPKVTIRGTAQIQWGWKVDFAMGGAYSDASLGLTGTDPVSGLSRQYRVEKVEHSFTFGQTPEFDTNLYIRPLSASGF